MAIKYHYCSYETFKNIIENQTIRLSDIKKSNDSIEMNLFYKQYEGMGELIYNYLKTNYGKEDEFWLGVERLIKLFPKITECLAICFSDGKDKLSQWERYGDRGRGVAIGFDEDGIIELVDSINSVIGKTTDETHFVKIISKKVEYKKIENTYAPSDAFEQVHENLKNHKYIEECAFTKHIGFHEEEEFRIALLFNNGNTEFLNNKKFQEEYFKGKSCHESESKKYIDIKFPKDIIRTVYLGPICSKETEYIKKVLRDQQYTCNVVRSETPYIPKDLFNFEYEIELYKDFEKHCYDKGMSVTEAFRAYMKMCLGR